MIENKVDNKNKIITYNISEIVPYINWAYFFYAWSMNGKAKDAQQELRSEAEKLLADMEGRYHTRAVFALCEANSEGDDIIINGTRVPMLRQQKLFQANQTSVWQISYAQPLQASKIQLDSLLLLLMLHLQATMRETPTNVCFRRP